LAARRKNSSDPCHSVAAGTGGAWYWWHSQQGKLPQGWYQATAASNPTKSTSPRSPPDACARCWREGDLVTEGQVLAASIPRSCKRNAPNIPPTFEEASMLEAKATVVQRQAELTLKEAKLRRASQADRDRSDQ
jgi:HlyD family secretion protein